MNTIEYMKDHLAEFIHSEARIEGAECTFADTEAILSRGKSSGASDTDIQIILNLKHAWEFLLENYNSPLSFELFSTYNKIVQENYKDRGGELRTKEISISNTDFVPKPRKEEDFYNIVDTALDTFTNDTDRALALLFLLCKFQFFWDGNKRSSQLLVNHYLAQQNSGLYLLIPEGDEETFLNDLTEFYENNMSLDDVTWLEGYIWSI